MSCSHRQSEYDSSPCDYCELEKKAAQERLAAAAEQQKGFEALRAAAAAAIRSLRSEKKDEQGRRVLFYDPPLTKELIALGDLVWPLLPSLPLSEEQLVWAKRVAARFEQER